MIRAAHLLQGSDEEVVEALYLGILGRFPDEAGHAHFLALVRQGAEGRARALEAILHSEEARARGTRLDLSGEATPEEARAAQAALRVAALRAEVAALRARPVGPDPALVAELAALRAAFDTLADEVRERLAALEQQAPAAANLSPGLSVGFVQDSIEASQARLEARLRRLESGAVAAGWE